MSTSGEVVSQNTATGSKSGKDVTLCKLGVHIIGWCHEDAYWGFIKWLRTA